MKTEKIKPIPKYILERIRKEDLKRCPDQSGQTRFYAYLSKNDGELVKVTVAVKNYRKQWHSKQCAVHGVHSERCFVKDMVFYPIGGYRVGWYEEGLQKSPRWYEDRQWGRIEDKYFDPWARIVNSEFLSKFPEYRYSAYKLYKGTNILKYLRLYEQYPQVEYLMKAGLSKFYDSVQILKKIGNDKTFSKWLIQNKRRAYARIPLYTSHPAGVSNGKTAIRVTSISRSEDQASARKRLTADPGTVSGQRPRTIFLLSRGATHKREYLSRLSQSLQLSRFGYVGR